MTRIFYNINIYSIFNNLTVGGIDSIFDVKSDIIFFINSNSD